MTFESERLIFRYFCEDDFDLFYSVFSNEQVMQYALIDRYTSKEALRPYFEQVLVNNNTEKDRKAFEFAVFSAKDSSFIGIADIEVNYQNSRAVSGEMGYFILPGYWGCGFGTEIAKALIDFAFSEIKLHRVVASCNAGNLQSERIMKKVGMVKEGEFRKARYKNGNWVNELKYGILVEEWSGL